MLYQTLFVDEVRNLIRVAAKLELDFASPASVLMHHSTFGGIAASGPTIIFFGYPDNEAACIEVADLYEMTSENSMFVCEPASDLRNWKN